MRDRYRSLTLILRNLLVVTLPILVAILIAGCPQSTTGEPPEPGNGVQRIEPDSFVWDTVRRPPRWRSSSPIEWMSTIEIYEILAKSREVGKPILCYISRYDLDVTSTIEEALFPADSWGQIIQDNFVPWELNWWESPGLAENILHGFDPPALVVIIPNPDEFSDDFRLADAWSGRALISFPLQTGRLPLGTPEADEKIASYQLISYDDLAENILEPSEGVDPDELSESTFPELADLLDGGSAIFPDELMYALYGNPLDNNVKSAAAERIGSWFDYMIETGSDLIWMPDSAFDPDGGWSIYPLRTMEAIFDSAIVNPDAVRDLEKLVANIGSLIYLESGNPGGGIPAYIDIRGTFIANLGYVNDDYDVLGAGGGLDNPVMGPRNIPWVNASILTRFMELAAIHPEMLDLELKPGVTVRQFIELDSNSIISKIVEDAREQGIDDVRVLASVLGLLNIAYQQTANPERLEHAGVIAEMCPPEEIDSWFDGSQYKFYPDLAIGLYHYGWLAESEDARESARLITEKCAEYAGYMDENTLRDLAFAHDVVHSPCPHVGIVGPVDDELSWELLAISLQDWDPRKVAQILDPERDAELIEAKWYGVMDEPTAYVCVDDSCYAPSSDPEKLGDTIEEVLENLAEERGE